MSFDRIEYFDFSRGIAIIFVNAIINDLRELSEDGPPNLLV